MGSSDRSNSDASGSGAADRSMPNTNAGWLSMLFGGGFLSAAGMALRRRK